MEWSTVLVYGLGLSNLMLAMLVFVLLARPDKMMGLLASVNGRSEEFRLGRLGQQDYRRFLELAEGLHWPAIALLFGWSFFSGALIRFLYI